MEESLQAFFYVLRGFINFLLELPLGNGATVGTVFFASIIVLCVLSAIGLIMPDVLVDRKAERWLRRNG